MRGRSTQHSGNCCWITPSRAECPPLICGLICASVGAWPRPPAIAAPRSRSAHRPQRVWRRAGVDRGDPVWAEIAWPRWPLLGAVSRPLSPTAQSMRRCTSTTSMPHRCAERRRGAGRRLDHRPRRRDGAIWARVSTGRRAPAPWCKIASTAPCRRCSCTTPRRARCLSLIGRAHQPPQPRARRPQHQGLFRTVSATQGHSDDPQASTKVLCKELWPQGRSLG